MRWVALLRGVNVGGHGKLPMKDFRAMLEGLGFGDVATYIQSGNAVFDGVGEAAGIAAAIGDALEAQFGFRRPVVVIPAEALARAIDVQPFGDLDDPRLLHLVFHAFGTTCDLAALNAAARDGEEARAGDGLTYFYTPNGFGKSRLAAQLERFFDGPVTARNLRSAEKIAQLADG